MYHIYRHTVYHVYDTFKLLDDLGRPHFFYARHSEFRTTAVSLDKLGTLTTEMMASFFRFTIYTPGTRKNIDNFFCPLNREMEHQLVH